MHASVSHPFTCRHWRGRKHWALTTVLAMVVSSMGGPAFVPAIRAQVQVAPVGQGFPLDAGDLRFIYEQILVAQDHAAGGTLLGPGPNQVADPQLPRGLRTVDGSFNNLVPDQEFFGKADRQFPRLTQPVFRPAEAGTTYAQKSGNVIDSQPRLISNLIVDQSADNPAALAAATNPCGEGGFVCSGSTEPDPDSGALFIPNITPDFGLSAPFNLTFTFFGQFFDHGLDLVTKGGGAVIMPLKADDPLFRPGSPTNFMVMTRATNLPGPDGVLGTADDVQEGINTTTPWVDQNQTYTSHPSHQVFLRQYEMTTGRPRPDGKVLDGGFCAPRPTTTPGDEICNIGNWAEVKAQASHKLGIHLVDSDVFNVPLVLTDPYGHFKPGPRGFPQLVLPGNVLLEGDPAANGGLGVDIPGNAFRTGHAFLDDIAHNAVPSPGLAPDADNTISVFGVTVQPAGTYDNELLDRHFVTGDGRGNENIALTTIHQLFHAEHNRLVNDIDRRINALLTPAEIAAWHSVHEGSGWGYGERLFQAARFVTEMQYQHLVFEEFARTIQPLINPFLGGLTSIDPAISAEFAHTVYRLGHSMLPERVGRMRPDGTSYDIRLLTAFLNPIEYNSNGAGGTLNAAEAAGAILRGTSRQVGNELDEFVTSSVRDTLVGLPLDLPAINIARGRSEGIPPLNEVRRQFYEATHDTTLAPYANWFEFGLQLKHFESLANFIAAYGTHPSITSAATVTAKRSAAQALVNTNDLFLFAPAATSGLNQVDFWIGGLAERQSVFGGLLGTTFNFVFEKQLENLQDGDRFYYLQRTDGLNLKTLLEGNSLAELARRNTNLEGTMDVIFKTPDFTIDAASFPGTAPVDLGDGASLLTLADGTKLFFDPEHRGKNIVFNGTPGDDRLQADIGDDSLFGHGGNDRLDGGEGNDTLLGGDGDDRMFGQNGDDVLKGGPGNDAMSGGPGFGGDLLLGAEGNDFMVGGDDGVEYFAGAGNDYIVDGTMRSEGIFGGTGDDWLDDGDGHDGGMFGDEGNVFDLLAGVSPIGGDDVMGGGPGQDNHFGEGGDDVFVMSEGSNKFFGDYGWDWVTQRAWPFAANIELRLLADPLINLNFNDLRNLYRFVDGASGWDLNDQIHGSNNVLCDPTAGEVAECLIPGMELTAAGAAKITGLAALMGPAGFDKNLADPAIPGIKGVGFMGGDILLGGRGSDVLEGKRGDDLIDGDVWLNVQLEARMNDGTVKVVNGPRELIDDVFSDPQRLNPRNIRIVKSIVTSSPVPADCQATAPVNCDTALFTGPSTEYAILNNANGTVTVIHTPLVGNLTRNDGTDTLRNIERLQFTDTVIPLAAGAGTIVLPNLVTLTQADAVARIAGLGLTVGTITTQPNAQQAGTIIGQVPAANTVVAARSTVSLFVSAGLPSVAVPSVVGSTQAAATSSITSLGLTVTVNTVTSAQAAAGTVIGQTPLASTLVFPGSAVTIEVAAAPVGLVMALNFDESSGIATDVSGSANNGTLGNGAVRIASGVRGGAVQFDGVNDFVTVADSNSLDLTSGMTLSAWVKPDDLNGWETVILKQRSTGTHSYGLYAQDGGAQGSFGPGGTIRVGTAQPSVAGVNPLPLGTWSHVATTYDGITQRVFVNGVEVANRPQAGNIVVGTGVLRIGGNTSYAGEYFKGAVDEVRVYNRALSATEIVNEMGGTVAPPPPPPPPTGPNGLVLRMNFDEAAGNATDTSGLGHVGAVTGAVRVPGVHGGSALSFDGVDDSVTIADANSLDITAGMTLEAWVNPGVLQAWESLIVKERGTGSYSYALYAHDGGSQPGGAAVPSGNVFASNDFRTLRGVSQIPSGTWTHIATTYDGVTQRLFINGVEVSSRPQTGTIAVGTGNLRIGGNDVWPGEYYQGLIDEVRIYNRALSAAEITADMGTAP